MLSTVTAWPGRRLRHPLKWRLRAGTFMRRRAAGLSLPELLVGLTLGLLITAAALALVALSSGEQRRLLAEARLQQDLRAAMDIVSRELRRSGQWPDAATGVWAVDPVASSAASAMLPAPVMPTVNPYGGFLAVPCNAAAAAVATPSAVPPALAPHACHVTAADDDATPSRSGFHVSRGALHAVLQGGSPQSVTDAAATTVRRFTVTSAGREVGLGDFCGQPCGDRCPGAALRAVVVELQATLPEDPRVQRRLQGTVRLRNDLLSGQCPAP
jgi:prepilin peptidase dependent protein B